jgi:hypothetical protein
VSTDPAGPPDLYVLAAAGDSLARAVLGAAARRGVRALLCSRYEYAAVLTVEVGRSGVRVTPDRPVLVRQHSGGVPPGPDASFISDEVDAHVKGGLSLLPRMVVNRPRIHGVSVLLPPAVAQYALRAAGSLPSRVTLAPELFRDRVHGGASGWEVQDLCTHRSCVGGDDTTRDTPQRLRHCGSLPFRYVSVLVAGTRTWVQVGAGDRLASLARKAAVEIASMTELQLAEVTFKSIQGQDTLEVARLDASPRFIREAPILAQAAEAVLDLLIAS